MTGWVLSHRHRYVTDLIVSSAATRDGAWCNFHRFFSRYKWSLDDVCRVTARLVIDTLVPRDAVITLAVDDTLCRKRGLGLYEPAARHSGVGRPRKKGSRLPSIAEWADDPRNRGRLRKSTSTDCAPRCAGSGRTRCSTESARIG